jgi:hypothetical protein
VLDFSDESCTTLKPASSTAYLIVSGDRPVGWVTVTAWESTATWIENGGGDNDDNFSSIVRTQLQTMMRIDGFNTQGDNKNLSQ